MGDNMDQYEKDFARDYSAGNVSEILERQDTISEKIVVDFYKYNPDRQREPTVLKEEKNLGKIEGVKTSKEMGRKTSVSATNLKYAETRDQIPYRYASAKGRKESKKEPLPSSFSPKKVFKYILDAYSIKITGGTHLEFCLATDKKRTTTVFINFREFYEEGYPGESMISSYLLLGKTHYILSKEVTKYIVLKINKIYKEHMNNMVDRVKVPLKNVFESHRPVSIFEKISNYFNNKKPVIPEKIIEFI